MYYNKNNKGFTLIELLVVIAIVAVLSVVVILTLNPAELLKQARDSNRISDMSTMRSAISLYLSDVNSPFIGTSTLCYFSASAATTAAAGCGFFLGSQAAVSSTNRGVGVSGAAAGNGWIPVNFTSISSGAPIGNEPIDPVNNASYLYGYVNTTTSLQFELDAYMESTKYNVTAGSAVVNNDGGDKSNAYESGTILTQ
ncbi:MAG: type II secretion system protein [bacterium]|nr:type II secretion system protein [bacterium]